MILEREDARLSYFVAGDGVPVTLLHGFTQSGRGWRELISRMPKGWKWIAPDLRGHGETQVRNGAPCSMDACTRDLVALWQLVWLIRRDRPKIVHTHAAKAGTLGRIAALIAFPRRSQRPIVIHTFHGHSLSGYFSAPATNLFLAIERFLARRTTRLVAVSEQVRDELVREAGRS